MPNDRQGRGNLEIDDQEQLVFDLKKPRGGDGSQRLFDTVKIFAKKVRALLLIFESSLDQLLSFLVGHLVVRARIFLNVLASQVVQLGQFLCT